MTCDLTVCLNPVTSLNLSWACDLTQHVVTLWFHSVCLDPVTPVSLSWSCDLTEPVLTRWSHLACHDLRPYLVCRNPVTSLSLSWPCDFTQSAMTLWPQPACAFRQPVLAVFELHLGPRLPKAAAHRLSREATSRPQPQGQERSQQHLHLWGQWNLIAQLRQSVAPQWGAENAEIKVPSGENTELKRSPFKAWNRSVYSRTCYAYCQEILPGFILHFQHFHLQFFSENFSRFFPALAVTNTGSCVGLQNKTGHPACCRFPSWVPTEYK